MKHFSLLLLLLTGRSIFYAHGQAPAQTAHDSIRPYTAAFQYGTNLGYYANGWTDEGLAGLAQAVGGHSVRPTLPEYFVDQYGYSIRVGTFNTYVNTLGMRELTCFVEGPSAAHRDPTTYPGCREQSKLFAHLYEPIWNSNGTVNANNYYASYLYQLLVLYGDKVRFWEVVNEPDFVYNSSIVGSWLTGPPAPADMVNLQAPIYHYIRMLRISYEVVKRYRPSAYVTVGGVGYAEFVDALLRYTDNPNGGAVTAAYPRTAGAYLDALSFHSYPSYSLHYWDSGLGGFRYTRTSDYAARKLIENKDSMQAVLSRRGYNGLQYPAKHLLVSETNVARRTSDDRTGTDELQRNYGIKALVLAQKHNIKQLYIFNLGEGVNAPPPTQPVSGADEIGLMGLYENLSRDAPGAQRTTPEGQAFATTSLLLYGASYDAARTAALALPSGVQGAAFRKNGTYVYALWAEALTDNSEYGNATYSFPAAWNLGGVQRYEWNYAATTTRTTQAPQNIALGGTPSFFSEVAAVVATGIAPTSAPVGATVTVTGTNLAGATSVRFNGTPTSAFASNSATQLVLNVPAGATTGPVTVTTPAGTSNGVAFTVVACAAGALAYPAPAYCQAGPNPLPTLAQPAGGTFSAPAGLSVNATTGALNLGASTPGTYTVTYAAAAADGCAATAATAPVTVNPRPATPALTATPQAGGAVLLTSSAPTGNQFYRNGMALAGATAPTYTVSTAAQNGAYTVVATSASGCASAASAPVTATVVLAGRVPAPAGRLLGLYPTPTPDGQLTVALDGYRRAVQLTVVNALGQTVGAGTVPAGQTAHRLDLHHLPAGVYVLRAQSEGGMETRRFVRQ